MLGRWGIVALAALFGSIVWAKVVTLRNAPSMPISLPPAARVVGCVASVQALLGVGLARYIEGDRSGAYSTFALTFVLLLLLAARLNRDRRR